MDEDESGRLSFKEFQVAARLLVRDELDFDALSALWAYIDDDGSGELTIKEFQQATYLLILDGWEDLLADLAPYIPENNGLQIWRPCDKIVSAVISALLRRRSEPEALMVEPSQPIPSGNAAGSSVCTWPLTPFSKPSRTKYQTYKSADDEYSRNNFQSTAIQSGLERL